MNRSIQFEKHKAGELAIFVCKDGGWQISKELGFHKCSPPRDYLVKWVEYDGKWSLYIFSYHYDTYDFKYSVDNCIGTVDTIFDVFDYICENKHTHY